MGRRPSGARRDAHDSDAILDAALTLAAERDWPAISLADVAAAAGVSLADLYAAYPSKAALLGGLVARTDAVMLRGEAAAERGPEETTRDRLFDLLMRRLESLAPHRQALDRIMRTLPWEPATLLCSAPRLLRAMAWTLEAAGVSSSGLRGLLRSEALAAAYLATVRTWLGDRSEDRARTMAALDRNLRRAGRLIGA